MKNYLIWTSIAVLVVTGCSSHSDSVRKRISQGQYESLMKMDYQSFDQTMDDGWRQYHDDPELQIQLILDYIEQNEATEQSLKWHLGQLYGVIDRPDDAVDYFRQCIYTHSDLSVYQKAWNYYVKGSIAFMEKDKEGLNLYTDSLRNHDETMNIEVLERLQANFDKPYKEAY
jgi:hypothetical protein